ncbi:radical SAM protein [Elusimicrobiota bacterium]
MNKSGYYFSGMKALYNLKVLHRGYPLALRWMLTDSCDNRCRYCTLWQNPRKMMPLDDIKNILDQVKKAGTIRISYSGGEPLLRNDITEILSYTGSLGITCSMNTNGSLIAKRKKAVEKLDLVKISLDGMQESHDKLSGRVGAYGQAIEGIEKCRQWNIPVIITTTITKHNISQVDNILELARRYEILVAFQPFKIMYKGSKEQGLCPSGEEYRNVILKLIDLKKNKYPYLRNSLTSLYHILDYPEFPRMKCAAGKLFSIIDVDGTLLPCDRNDGQIKGSLRNVREGYLEVFRSLPEYDCTGCGFLGGRELTYFANFIFEGMSSIKKVIK